MSQVTVCALYHFVKLFDVNELKGLMMRQLELLGVKGTLILAEEGINGTIAGSASAIHEFLTWLKRDTRFDGLSYKLSYDDAMPFYRTKVKLKKEIVTMGVADLDPTKVVGRYVKPGDWNKLLADPELMLIDTRNKYEIEVGTFRGAINPKIGSFREFPKFVSEQLDPAKHKKVAMFCTGGIRCEKSTAYLKSQGFDEVYHLEGGILKYLQEVDASESLWQGDCFVFDNRVAVNHELKKGNYEQCHACRMPLTEEETRSKHYSKGVSCPKCYESHSEQQVKRFEERRKQINLSAIKGQPHIGSDMRLIAKANKSAKTRARSRQRAL